VKSIRLLVATLILLCAVMAVGGYALLPAEMRHFAWTKDGATIQVHGMGPFVLNYVNPADDPSKGAPAQ
jgi:hypothetical protein